MSDRQPAQQGTDRAADLCRRLDEAAAFMEQGKAVYVPVLLLSAKAEIERLRHELVSEQARPKWNGKT